MCRAVLRDSVDGPVQETGWFGLVYLRRESTFRRRRDIGERRRPGATTSLGGAPGRRASRRRFLHNTTCNSISANYELARSCP